MRMKSRHLVVRIKKLVAEENNNRRQKVIGRLRSRAVVRIIARIILDKVHLGCKDQASRLNIRKTN